MWLGRKKSSGTWPNKAGKRTEAREIIRERKNETNTVKRLRMKGKLWKMRETRRVRERLVMRQREDAISRRNLKLFSSVYTAPYANFTGSRPVMESLYTMMSLRVHFRRQR